MSRPKVILLDVDGVLIKYRRNFTDELRERGYPDAAQIMQPYYHAGNSALYNEGQETEEKLIGPYLEKLGWKGSVRDYLDAQGDFARSHLDRELLTEIQKIRQGGTWCCIATNQGPYQGRFLLEKMEFDKSFDGHYISSEVGYKKDMEGFWEHVLGDLADKRGVNPWETAYFDDRAKNIEVASTFGIQSFLFAGNLQFENDMNMLGFDVSFNKFQS